MSSLQLGERPQVEAAPRRQRRAHGGRTALVLLALLLGGYAALTVAAMLRQSTTFDEIVLIAGGARGFATGQFDIAPEHPPLTQYLYGLPVHISGVTLPPADLTPVRGEMGLRYVYARVFFWSSGNDAERITLLGRLPAVLCGMLLIGLVFAWTRRHAGAGAALLAAGLVALLPDVLAHGGVAYNDIALAPVFFGALWAIDAALRRPTAARAALAGVCVALALLTKFSAVALLPAAGLLLVMEAWTRRDRAAWLRGMVSATAVLLAAGYLTLALGYRGDWTLEELRYGLDFTFMHVNEGHGTPAYLLGSKSATGWWYFYPVAFLLKTPAALHVLIVLAAAAALRRAGPFSAATLHRLAGASVRMPVAGLVAFAAALLASSLNIGFRYALPLLPFVCVLVALGVAPLWRSGRRVHRAALAGVLAWYAASVLWFYPNFLAYTSEYVADRQRGDAALLDSSLDWGQGLIQLRELMAREGIERVYLSYFGSGLPGGYGIDYEPLPSFFAIPQLPTAGRPAPRYVALSATNLHGIYLTGDPFARFRAIEPDYIVARSLFLYRIHDAD